MQHDESRSATQPGQSALHIVVEPFHFYDGTPNTVLARVEFTPAGGDNTSTVAVFQRNFTSVRHEIEFRASADVHASRAHHTIQVLPHASSAHACKDNGSFIEPAREYRSDAGASYVLKVFQAPATTHDRGVRVVRPLRSLLLPRLSPHDLCYGVVSVPRRILSYKYCKLLEMLRALMKAVLQQWVRRLCTRLHQAACTCSMRQATTPHSGIPMGVPWLLRAPSGLCGAAAAT